MTCLTVLSAAMSYSHSHQSGFLCLLRLHVSFQTKEEKVIKTREALLLTVRGLYEGTGERAKCEANEKKHDLVQPD